MIELTGTGLAPAAVVAVARNDEPVRLADSARGAMEASAAIVERHASSDEPVYGVSTGFGSLANTVIPPERREELQRALIRSHAAGMGPPVEREVVRAMMLLRARTLAMGYSGARPLLVDTMLELLNRGLTPIVPEHGSLGASGDLAPLAHAALALIGEGEVVDRDGRVVDAASAGIAPVTLRAKEGLALVNGTDGILGMLLLALHDLDQLLVVADIACRDDGRGVARHRPCLRRRPPTAAPSARSAPRARRTCARSSPVPRSSRATAPAISACRTRTRCAARRRCTARRATRSSTPSGVAAAELVSAIDNPMVLPDGRIESCGNFHGAPLGFACDFLAIAAAEVGAIAERRTDRLLDATRSQGLPPFLAPDAGVNSGMMIGQYTMAAMVAENRRLAAPASVDSLPTSAMQEDHVSMAWGAARKLRRVVANLARILAIEVTCAARGLDLRVPLAPAAGTAAALAAVRAHVDGPGPDRRLAPELAAVEVIVVDGSLRAAVEAVVGRLW